MDDDVRWLKVARTFAIECGWALIDEGLLRRPRLFRNVLIVVANGRIADIKTIGSKTILPTLNARNHLVLPGFISAHTHVIAGLPTRGLIEAGRPYLRPLELLDGLSDDDLDALTAANLAEIVGSGGTTQLEMSLTLKQAKSYVRVISEWGIRGYPSVMVPGANELQRIWFRKSDNTLIDAKSEIAGAIAEGLSFAREVGEAGNALIRPMMAAHATDTQTPDTLESLKHTLREVKAGLHIHIAQRTTERDSVERMWGCSPVRFLERAGLLEQPVFGAHMTAVDWEADGALLRERGVVYAHCPSAGGAGVSTQPFPEALFHGVNTAIGLDTHSNDCLENIKLAAIKGRTRALAMLEAGRPSVTPPTIEDAVHSSARASAEGLNREDLGRLQLGARADIVAIDITGPLVGSGALPPEPFNNLLYANGKSVTHVAIDGVIKIANGKLLTADEAAVRTRAASVMEGIWERLEREDWFEDKSARRALNERGVRCS